MNTASRLSRLWSVVSDASNDPHYRARAQQVAGVALIADGLVGIENPLDGRSKRAGILGSVVLVAVGLIFWFTTGLLETKPYPDGKVTTGIVTGVERHVGTDTKNRSTTTCSIEVTYEVDGRVYTVSSGVSASYWCDEAGKLFEVSYRPQEPAAGRVLDQSAEHTLLLTGPRVLGGIIIVAGVLTFLVRAASIVAGIVLVVRGRRGVRAHPQGDTDGLMQRLGEAWGAPGAATPGAGPTAAMAAAPALGALSNMLGPAVAAPPASAGPPPGWYDDPYRTAQLRWWDGTAWTEHTTGG